MVEEDTGLRRALGPASATCLVVGAIVGVGIFFTPSKVAAITGSPELALVTWGAGGLLALLGALTFAELGGIHRGPGAQYIILRDAFGPLLGFLFVFCNSTAILAGAAAIIALICAQNLGIAVTGSPLSPGAVTGMAVILVCGLVFANSVGVRWGAAIQNVTVIAKLATLALITGLAVGAEAPPVTQAAPTPEDSAVALVFAGLVHAMFTFGGWQHALWMGGEVRNPQRTVPFAIVVGVLVVIAVYMAANWAYFALLGYDGVASSKSLAADAVSAVWPTSGRRFIAAAVAFSAFGVLNAQLLGGPRLLYSLARDGRFFRSFARVHARHATPVPAIALIGFLTLALILVAGESRINHLVNGVVLVDAVFFVFTGLSLFILRQRRPREPGAVRVPLYPIVPALFVLGEMAVVVGAFLIDELQHAAWIGLVWIAVGILLYLVCFRRSP
jgi:APA family basic amino acid/polyamine antiporter